jgi:mono/diheme cytochrome c family protein
MSGSLIPSLIAAGLALSTSGCAADLNGAKMFNERCLNCHTISEVGQRLAGFTPEDRAKHLERYLTAHHAPDRAECAAIIKYINEQLDKKR